MNKLRVKNSYEINKNRDFKKDFNIVKSSFSINIKIRFVKRSFFNKKDTTTITTSAVNRRRSRLQIAFTKIIHIHIILHHEIMSCLFIV